MSTRSDLWLLGLLLLLPCVANGQETQGIEDDCLRADRSLRTLPEREEYHRVLPIIMSCRSLGPPALVREWSRPPTDSVSLRLLAQASSELRDRRILVAVRSAALDERNPRETRVAALGTLVSYYDPWLSLAFLDQTDSSRVSIGEFSHRMGRNGTEPLPATVKKSVFDVLKELASSTRDPVLAKVSAYLVKWLPVRSRASPGS